MVHERGAAVQYYSSSNLNTYRIKDFGATKKKKIRPRYRREESCILTTKRPKTCGHLCNILI
jgi:hypothetical protein